MKKFLLLSCFLLFTIPFFAQETLKSYEENYYDMLSLTGESNRNFINFRTLSNSIWKTTEAENLPWEPKNLGSVYSFKPFKKASNWFVNGINQSFDIKVFALDFYNSFNTKAPFGQNDSTLWQGRGYNTSLSTGFNLKAYGFEATFKPQFTFCQNLAFDIMKSEKGSEYSEYGYWYGNADAVQRYGDLPVKTFDFGDSEIRYNFYNFTIGYGTQQIWLGPAVINPLLLSNNAAPFPKFDIGINRTPIKIPGLNWYLGDIELHSWVGKLKESDFFDNDSSNDFNQYSGFSIAWALPYLKGLTIGFNKICICNWGDAYWLKYLNPFFSNNTIHTSDEENISGEDQKASLTIDWVLEPAGFEFYSEIGVDDYLSKGLVFYEYARFPFHTMTFTVGLKKSLNINPEKRIRGVINFEWNSTEGSRDYYNWGGTSYNFGFHHQIKQGYTNKGQWLGSGIGYGGNSQYLDFTLYSPHGYDKFFVFRNNPDNNYVNYKINMGVSAGDREGRWYTAYKANFVVGAETMWFIHNDLSVKGGMLYNLIINPLYNPGYTGTSENGSKVYREYTYWNNFQFNLEIKYNL